MDDIMIHQDSFVEADTEQKGVILESDFAVCGGTQKSGTFALLQDGGRELIISIVCLQSLHAPVSGAVGSVEVSVGQVKALQKVPSVTSLSFARNEKQADSLETLIVSQSSETSKVFLPRFVLNIFNLPPLLYF